MLTVRPRSGQLTVAVAGLMVPIRVSAKTEGPGETNAPEGPLTKNLIEVVFGLEAVADGCGVCLKPFGIEDSPVQPDTNRPVRPAIKIAAPLAPIASRLTA
jgi:hypothetical protein